MDTIEDTPEETFSGPIRSRWTRTGQSGGRSKARGRPFRREADWRLVALIGAGVAAGMMIGAGIALLTAPQSGAHTRLVLTREMRRRTPWRNNPWDQLGEALHKAARGRNHRNGSRVSADSYEPS
jgi:hypothetical protein